VGYDELGREVYETPLGHRYAMTEQERTTPAQMRNALAEAASDPLGTARGVALAVAEGAWNGVSAPGRALQGETLTYGDVADTALDWGVMSAVGRAPRGALRSGAMRVDAPYGRGIDGTYVAELDGRRVGSLNVSPRAAYASSVQVLPDARRQGVASALYDAAEADLGRRMMPSPLGMSDDAMAFWQRRLSGLSDSERRALLQEAVDVGQQAGVGRSATERMAQLGWQPETPAQQVARLLREGRASEVTDDLMAQVDPQEMARLYESGACRWMRLRAWRGRQSIGPAKHIIQRARIFPRLIAVTLDIMSGQTSRRGSAWFKLAAKTEWKASR